MWLHSRDILSNHHHHTTIGITACLIRGWECANQSNRFQLWRLTIAPLNGCEAGPLHDTLPVFPVDQCMFARPQRATTPPIGPPSCPARTYSLRDLSKLRRSELRLAEGLQGISDRETSGLVHHRGGRHGSRGVYIDNARVATRHRQLFIVFIITCYLTANTQAQLPVHVGSHGLDIGEEEDAGQINGEPQHGADVVENLGGHE